MRRAIYVLVSVLVVAIIAGVASAETTADAFNALSWDKSHAGEKLDLTGYHLTFEDEFDALSVTADPGPGPWFAPVHGPWGAGKMLPPGPKGPFSVSDGKLTITGVKNAKGKWSSGTMQTVDAKGNGFVQQYGYFEMCAQFPPGPGAWPAFWLKSQNSHTDLTATRTELDAIEWYGSDPKGLHSTVHLWPAKYPKPGSLVTMSARAVTLAQRAERRQLSGYHAYGVMITPEWIITYYDRKELERFSTLPEFKTPHYMLVSLAIEKRQPTATSPKIMKVNYVRAYAPGAPGSSAVKAKAH